MSEGQDESISGQMKVYETLADNAANCNLYGLAIKHYLKVVRYILFKLSKYVAFWKIE